MHQLKGVFQHYNWGGKTFLPSLFTLDNKDQLPYAEYWLGAHPSGDGAVRLDQGAKASLLQMIRSDRKRYLGTNVTQAFGELPFLLKILDVREMLSIQVHPTKAAANKGFERENAQGIPLGASHRNYKDKNHKPEMMVALSDFWLLHGFSSTIQERIITYPFLKAFEKDFIGNGIKGIFKAIMELPQVEVNEILQVLEGHIVPAFERGTLDKTTPEYWAAKAMKQGAPQDRGIISLYLFNILELRSGQGVFQGAGMPHAYLEGQNIELMSNSDNVLRAGLTNKHVDIPELMANTVFEPTIPKVFEFDLDKGVSHYDSPVPDFTMKTLALGPDETVTINSDSPSILLALKGELIWQTRDSKTVKTSGVASFFVLPSEELVLRATDKALVFWAEVP